MRSLLKLYVVSLLLVLMQCAVASAQDVQRRAPTHRQSSVVKPTSDSVLTLVGRWAWGECGGVAVAGNYAYIGNGSLFQVLDIHVPSSPAIAGEYLTGGAVYDLQLRDSLAFVCMGDSLIVLDVSVPAKIHKVGDISLGGGAMSVRLEDSLAYVLNFGGKLYALDISHPAAIRLRGSIFTLSSFPGGFTAIHRHVYVGDQQGPGMDIIDATNPDTLTKSQYATWIVSAAGACDTLLFLSTGNLEVYSITNPGSPVFLGEVSNLNASSITVRDTVAYVTSTSGVKSISITDPSNLRILTTLGIGGVGIAVSGTHLLSNATHKVYVVDVPTPDTLRFASVFYAGGWSEKIALKDSLAFIASAGVGLWVVDVSDPTNPKSVAPVYTAGFTSDVVVTGITLTL